MFGEFTQYIKISATPEAISAFTLTNPLGVIPKYVHIECPNITSSTDLREVHLTPSYGAGFFVSAGGDLSSSSYKPTEATSGISQYYFTANEIKVRSTGAGSGRWRITEPYDVHFYA